MKWILSISFLFVGCVHLPRSTAQLTVLLGNQIAESKLTHLNLIDEWAKERRARTEQFLEYRWIPTFIDNFMDPVGEPSKNLKSALKSDCRPVIADEIKEITSAVSKQIEKKRKERIEKIVAHQFDLVTNLSQEAYFDSLKLIAQQIIELYAGCLLVEPVQLEVLREESADKDLTEHT